MTSPTASALAEIEQRVMVAAAEREQARDEAALTAAQVDDDHHLAAPAISA